MKLICQTPKKATKPFLRQRPERVDIDRFKENLISLLDKIEVIEKLPFDESEEHLKNNIRDFLRDTWYRDSNAINTKDKKDLVIHLGKTTASETGVIIEAKRPSNTGEMITAEQPNRKAMHELILYYLDERNKSGNIGLKQLVATNIYEWYVIDSNYFDKHIYRNSQIQKLYKTKINDHKDNPFFYEELAKIIGKLEIEIPCVSFDIRNFEKILRNSRKDDDRELIALYKILSPLYLLKIAPPNDSNSLDDKFYRELLHIIGLEEVKEGSKNIIRRKKEKRNPGSFIELTIEAINAEDRLHHLPDQSVYGVTREERIFNVALELCITWINRILFLKLLESQLVTYHKGDKSYCFLNSETIHDFDELFKLFHRVLAVNLHDRSETIREKYSRVPYLNSSLFEISELEDQIVKINSLENNTPLEIYGTSVLKDINKKNGKLSVYDYLFRFLDAYDFSSEGKEDIKEDGKTIINASVLGKVFEKINGYKDGSIFTPGFITMYMCKQSIRAAVSEKFGEYCLSNGLAELKPEDFEGIYNLIPKQISIPKANDIINSLKICDPAVGSGHFLVSALNEIIAIKGELGILTDENGKLIRDEIEIINDELIVTNSDGDPFSYNYRNAESCRIQKTLFHEKQKIIENCLFGVDINPNSVKICRLRLWIELLKNAYYKETENIPGKETENIPSLRVLETLPNIDINIKCGNSLLSRFSLDADLSKALKSITYDIKAYRGFVNEYKNEKNREVKRELHRIIDRIKSNFRTNIDDPFKSKMAKARGELDNVVSEINRKKQWGEKVPAELRTKLEKITNKVNKLDAEKEAVLGNAIYKNAFEWRFEFPELLNDNGEFEGFDVVIGNPPYVFARENFNPALKTYFAQNYQTSQYQVNLYLLFIELTISIMKKRGEFTLIVPNAMLMVSSAKSLRKHLLNEIALNEIINLMGQTFEGINVEPIIISGKKESKSHSNKISIYVNDEFDFILNHVKEQSVFSNNEGSEFTVFSNKSSDDLTLKLKERSELLDNLVVIKAGLQAYESGKGVPKQSPEDVKARPYDYSYKYDENTFEYLEGRDVLRYQINWSGTFLKYGDNLAAPRTFDLFNGRKIIIREITGKHPNSIIATFTDKVFLFNRSNIAIIERQNTEISLKYILGILNSTLMSYYFMKNTAKSVRKMFPKLILEDLRKFPIKVISPDEQLPFIELVDKVLSMKSEGLETDELEKQIDEMVYGLYGVTEEERGIIENV